ncbi:MAG: hypothetical protein ACM30I_06645 [Gemmatimonas sp.]
MRGIFVSIVVVLAAVGGSAARAADAWSELWVPEPGFVVEFPAQPTFATRPVPWNSEGRQQYWALERGGRMFVVSVVEMPPTTTPPVPTIDYYGRVIERYAAGSHAMLREDYPATVAGLPGFEALLDDWNDNVHHLLDVVQVGNRLYMIGSAGPKGHEAGPDAIRFRDSFRLLGP